MDNDIKQAITILRQGGIVIFPTDTAFGIGCRMDVEASVNRLFQIRHRPFTKAVPVLVSNIEMAQEYLLPIPDNLKEHLTEIYWPGALTVIYHCRTDKVPLLVRGGGKTLGVRMPAQPLLLEVIRKVGIPILAPSANFHGQKTPYEMADLDPNLVNKVDFVLPGECLIKNVSTVIDCSITPWNIIREGAVKLSI